jgi:hypothetical protein
MTHPDALTDDPDVQRHSVRRRQLAALLWASRRLDRQNARAVSEMTDALVDLRVTLRRATAWGPGPELPEQ